MTKIVYLNNLILKSGNLNNLILMPVSLNTAYISKYVFANIHQICEINYKLKKLNVGTPGESTLLPGILSNV